MVLNLIIILKLSQMQIVKKILKTGFHTQFRAIFGVELCMEAERKELAETKNNENAKLIVANKYR